MVPPHDQGTWFNFAARAGVGEIVLPVRWGSPCVNAVTAERSETTRETHLDTRGSGTNEVAIGNAAESVGHARIRNGAFGTFVRMAGSQHA